MFSQRFQLSVSVTRHARQRMAQRNIDDDLLLDLIETGDLRYKDEVHLWLFKHVQGRGDNLLCVAALLQDVLIVKTVMHRFQPGEPQ